MRLRQILYIPVLAIALCAGISTTAAQTQGSYPPVGAEWSLADCINYALENNIQLKSQELNAENSRIDEQQAKLNFIPSLGVGGSYSYSFGRASDPTTNQFNSNFSSVSASVSSGTTIFAGLANHHNLKAAGLTLKNTLLELDKARNDLSLSIVAAYMDVLLAQENVIIYEAMIETQRMQLEDTRKLVEAGRVTMSDLLQMESDYANMEYQLIAYRNSLRLAYFTLCQYLELPDYESFRVVSPEEFALHTGAMPNDKNEIFELAMALPQVQSSIVSVELANRNIKLAKASYWPSLSFSVGYGSSFSNAQKDYSFSNQIKDNKGGSLGLSLNIPIFNSLQVRNNVKKSKIAYQIAEYDYQLTLKQLNNDVERAYIDAEGALAQLNSSDKSIATNEESFRVMGEKYRLGAATPVEYNKALMNLLTAKSQFVQAKYQYMFKLRILEFYMGLPLNVD